MVKFQEDRQKKKLATLRIKEEEDLARILSAKYGLEYIDLSTKSINTDALRLLTQENAKRAEVALFAKIGKKISIALRTPNNEYVPEILDDLKRRGFVLTQYMVSLRSLQRAWERYADISFAVETKEGILDISGEEIKKIIENTKTLLGAKTEIAATFAEKKTRRISRTFETILAAALSNNASDIHIEPEETIVRLRFRLDGVLTELLDMDLETYNLLLSRIKLLSGLKLNIKDNAQDGRFSVVIGESDIEIRTSVLPGAYGESIVLRVLNPDTLLVPLEELGMRKHIRELIAREVRKPNGMILNTGPTGSGKTTTLYSFLSKIHTPEIKIVTIEDPIEYHLKGIVQTQVDKKYTFNKGLVSTLRQDPDVIMVGEIRDNEVASTAIQAALTGHLVFSTLHTNNASGAIPRLIDLGVNPNIIGSSLNIIMAQRLVRKLKDDCKKEVKLKGKQKEFVDSVLATIKDKSLIPENTSVVWEAIEGDECELGYKGRIGVFEVIEVTGDMETLIQKGPSEREVDNFAQSQGTLTMIQDGVLKVLEGITTISELERILDVDVR